MKSYVKIRKIAWKKWKKIKRKASKNLLRPLFSV
jgi:hypothetical protein